MIQGSINQLLGQVAIFGTLDPNYEARIEKRKLAKKEKFLKEQKEAALSAIKNRDTSKGIEELVGHANILQETAAEVESLRKRQFEISPSTESYNKYLKSKSVVKDASSIKKDISDYLQAQAEQKAEASLQREQKRIVNSKPQKRNFMDYLGKQETSLGGTVSELPADVQKHIASQYSKAQRQHLMNSMDKEELGIK